METKIGCHKIDRLILPTVFHDSADMIAKVLKSKNYDVALAIGQAGGRSEITPERVGINIDDARIKDNQDTNLLIKLYVTMAHLLIF